MPNMVGKQHTHYLLHWIQHTTCKRLRFGYEYIHAYTQWQPHVRHTTPDGSSHQRHLECNLRITHAKCHEDGLDFNDLLWRELAELQLPMGNAYLSCLVPIETMCYTRLIA